MGPKDLPRFATRRADAAATLSRSVAEPAVPGDSSFTTTPGRTVRHLVRSCAHHRVRSGRIRRQIEIRDRSR